VGIQEPRWPRASKTFCTPLHIPDAPDTYPQWRAEVVPGVATAPGIQAGGIQ